MLTIGLIDTQPVTRFGVVCCLRDSLKRVRILEADNLPAFYNDNSDQVPGVIILGINQNLEENNFETLKDVKKYYPSAALVMYDTELRSFKTVPSLGALIDGYVLKTDAMDDLVNCVKKVAKGKRFISKDLVKSLKGNLPVKRRSTRGSRSPLTLREYEVATYLSQGMRTSRIARALGRKDSTISTYKNHIFQKLKIDNIIKLKDAIFPNKSGSL